jgi:hypothetical protein
MIKIHFSGISESLRPDITALFKEIKSGKQASRIDEPKIKQILGNRYESKFWHPSKEEREQWMKEWFETPVDKRTVKAISRVPFWDFGSWIDSLNSADIKFVDFYR